MKKAITILATFMLAGFANAAVTNLCRCGTYQRVRAAIHRAAAQMKKGGAA